MRNSLHVYESVCTIILQLVENVFFSPISVSVSLSLSLARVDMAGGWTDTPPQAYEFGGSVVTLALTINNGVRELQDCGMTLYSLCSVFLYWVCCA